MKRSNFVVYYIPLGIQQFYILEICYEVLFFSLPLLQLSIPKRCLISSNKFLFNKCLLLKPLKALNCGVGGDRIQHVLWRALNLPVFSNLKNVVVLCGTNNLLLDSPKDVADGILEISRSLKTNYSYVNVIICVILALDDNWSVNRVSIKNVNQILRFKCYESSYTLLVTTVVGLLRMVPIMQIFIIQIDYT